MKISPSLSPKHNPARMRGRRAFISVISLICLLSVSPVIAAGNSIQDWHLANLLGEAIEGARFVGGDEAWKNRGSAETSGLNLETGAAYTLFRSKDDLTVAMLKTATQEVSKTLKRELNVKGISSESSAVAGSAGSPATSETRFSASFQGTRGDGTVVWISFYIVPTDVREFAVVTSFTTVGKK